MYGQTESVHLVFQWNREGRTHTRTHVGEAQWLFPHKTKKIPNCVVTFVHKCTLIYLLICT
jgi:hypothetical protein